MDEEKKESELNTKSSGFPISGLIRFTIVLLLVGAVSGYGFSHEWFKAVGSVSADEYSDDDDGHWDDGYIIHEGTTKVSAEEIGTIIMDGTTIRIPSKYSDISNLIEVYEEDQEEMAGGMAGHSLGWIALTTDGQSNGVILQLSNDLASRISVEDAVVRELEVDTLGNTQADVVFYGGIKIGQSKEDFLNVIEEFFYRVEEDEDSDYSSYVLFLGEDEEYTLIVHVDNGKVIEIRLEYDGD